MLISHPGLMTIRRKLSGLMSDGSIDEATETQSLTKTIQLLVGHRGKGEYMCIGGPWSPSLDGQNPLDPVTLVKTAIRTTRAMTGLNLSDCSKWYKIAHLRYLRAERQRIDSVVLMLPDTSAIESFKVDEESYKMFEQSLRDQLAVKLAAIDAEQFNNNEKKETEGENVDGEKSVVEKGVGGGIEKAATTTTTTSVTSTAATSSTSTLIASVTTSAAEVGVEPPSKENNAVPDLCIATEEAMDSSSPQKSADTSQETLQSPKKETKTHWSLLEPVVRTMKVAELREELELRGLDSKGLKNVLSQRLSEAIGKEKENDEKNENQGGQQQEKQADEAMPDTEQQQQQNLVSKEQQQEEAKPNEQQPPAQKSNTEPSIMVKIKEEIIELMETDEAPEEKKESPEEQAKREKLEKERQELEKAKEKFEKEKKERKATLERHYSQIPKEPGIFVYPSKTAKGGKFECKLMSIHSLLDYRQDDIKESSFEVFLFVEALREAIDRSNAFVVYHSVATCLDREAEKKRRNETLSEACKDEDVVERVNYRDLTDKWVDKEGNVKYIPEPIYQGGGRHSNLELKSVSSNNTLQTTNNEASSDIFFYEGKIVNIKQCIQQQQAMEEERQAVLDKNNELDLQLKTTKEQRDLLEKKKRRLEDDVDRYRKKLHDTEKSLKKEKDDNEVCKRSLTDCKRYGQRIISIEGENVKNNNGENGGGKEAAGGGKEGGKEAKENKETSSSDVVLLDECKDDTTTNNSFKEENNQAQKADSDVITEPISVEMVVTEGEEQQQQVTKQGGVDVEQNLENKNEGGGEEVKKIT
uniref:SAP domain-containing protein n=1 Tax=Meloidogyne javanica TaxID=6303 RepID=A0A915NDE0_MELJA